MATDADTPTVALVIGMAGSGKTCFTQRLVSHLTEHEREREPWVMNLDPGVLEVPYLADVDIRDTINYKEVMDTYQLGPNGAIMTCLNLFTAQFDTVLTALEEAKTASSYALVDTPGQIEVFTWSASGTIISETLASLYPTVILYLLDTTRCTRPATFMSNMLYACSILYKSRLPMILVFNKTDETPHEDILNWMQDLEAFQTVLSQDTSFMASLIHSMSLVLEEFYAHLSVVGVSAQTGHGFDVLLTALEAARAEYKSGYGAILAAKIAAQGNKDDGPNPAQAESLLRLMRGLRTRDT